MNIFKRLFGKKNEKIIISILDLATKQADGTESSIAKYIPMEISEILNLSDKIACNYYHLQIPGDTKEIISDSIYPEKVIDDLMYSTKSNYVVYGYIDINDLKNIEFKIFLYSNKYKKIY